MAISIDKEILILRQIPEIGQHLGKALQALVDGANALGKNLSADPTQTMPQPPTIQKLNVKASGGTVHATITDNNPIQKNLHYFVEYDTSPAFAQPHVVHLGASRSMSPISLPALDDNGQPQPFYFRAYSQYPGSHPGEVQHFGGSQPTAVNSGGSLQMTLLPSTGSGTAQATGQQGGSGFGKVLFRPAVGPKRQS